MRAWKPTISLESFGRLLLRLPSQSSTCVTCSQNLPELQREWFDSITVCTWMTSPIVRRSIVPIASWCGEVCGEERLS